METQDIQKTTPLDRAKINCPRPQVTREAALQILLMKENDFTLEDKFFRIKIDGKGCDGFTYATGFTQADPDDFRVLVPLADHLPPLILLMDPFTAFYLQKVIVDYVCDPVKNVEGFVVNNLQQDQFAGKFWRGDDSKVPPVLKN